MQVVVTMPHGEAEVRNCRKREYVRNEGCKAVLKGWQGEPMTVTRTRAFQARDSWYWTVCKRRRGLGIMISCEDKGLLRPSKGASVHRSCGVHAKFQ
jgi:hypothetical protein